jgi:membrane glycosyltransferase
MAVLLVPKLLSYVALLVRSEERRGCGGGGRALLSVLIETLIAGLMAPVTMLTQSGHVVAILLGRDAGWQPQRRDDGVVPFSQVIRLYWRHTCLGLLFGGTAWLVSSYLALWMSPMVLGLALAIPLAALTAALAPGTAFRRLGLLLTPEEVRPPAILATAGALYRELKETEEPTGSGLGRLVSDPILAEEHRRMLPPPRQKGQDPIDVPLLIALARIDEAETGVSAWNTMNREERAASLGNAEAFDRLLALPLT